MYAAFVLRPCLVCQRLTPSSYCPQHQPVRKTPGRSSRPQDRFRQAVLDRAGHRCQWLETDGDESTRCPETSGLEAHHLMSFRGQPSMDPDAGICLCVEHHHRVEQMMRDYAMRAAGELAMAGVEHWSTEQGKAQAARMRQRAAR
jgi:hypothetical protein